MFLFLFAISIQADSCNIEFYGELSISRIEFQNNDNLLHSLKSGLFGYIVQKLRFFFFFFFIRKKTM